MCTSTQVQIKSLANKQKRKQRVTRPLLLLNYIQLRFQTQPNTPPTHTHTSSFSKTPSSQSCCCL